MVTFALVFEAYLSQFCEKIFNDYYDSFDSSLNSNNSGKDQ